MVKGSKKSGDSKKSEESKIKDDNPVSSKKGKKEKEIEKPKIEEGEEDIKPEEGVLTFYIELQYEPESNSEKGLPSDSDDD